MPPIPKDQLVPGQHYVLVDTMGSNQGRPRGPFRFVGIHRVPYNNPTVWDNGRLGFELENGAYITYDQYFINSYIPGTEPLGPTVQASVAPSVHPIIQAVNQAPVNLPVSRNFLNTSINVFDQETLQNGDIVVRLEGHNTHIFKQATFLDYVNHQLQTRKPILNPNTRKVLTPADVEVFKLVVQEGGKKKYRKSRKSTRKSRKTRKSRN
jgi:hypothetical protein